MNMAIERGMLFLAENRNTIGSEMSKKRPYIIIQNDKGNSMSSTVLCCPITSSNHKGHLETHVYIKQSELNGGAEGYILCEQIFTYDKSRLQTYLGRLGENEMKMVDKALAISVNLSTHEEDKTLTEKSTKDLMIERHIYLKDEMDKLEKQLCSTKIKIEEYKQEFAFLDSYVKFKTVLPSKDDLVDLINNKDTQQIVKEKEETKENKKKIIHRKSKLLNVSEEIIKCLEDGINDTEGMATQFTLKYGIDIVKARKSVSNGLQSLRMINKARPITKGVWQLVEKEGEREYKYK